MYVLLFSEKTGGKSNTNKSGKTSLFSRLTYRFLKFFTLN
ncbi:hypothetical protein FORC49_1093 [Listeria monocytogenes]|nr:hypothetical protein LMntsn_1079 [Listeria monocytogenes]EGJ24572.1 hypothetical protein LMOSA_19600 [Listeria monocytogenes str. Scott A]EXL17175.1 hypothetical protein X845_1134 [Listeria monocytogenes Lm_1824]CBY69990.1 hypothetical protein LMOATCC19117_1091 [Listeria monocytogenes ATCC 19117]ASL50166.1 hypothetical protein FORC49_1093 [Listeria monocytogenes]